MKKTLLALSISLSLMSASADASDGKIFAIGFGANAQAIDYEGGRRDRVDGYFLAGQAILYDFGSLQVGGLLNAGLAKDSAVLESEFLDASVVFGPGLNSQGFKAYLGAGFFYDSWKGDFDSLSRQSFNGGQLIGGIGYNWSAISIDVMANHRKSSNYSSSGLVGDRARWVGVALSYRF